MLAVARPPPPTRTSSSQSTSIFNTKPYKIDIPYYIRTHYYVELTGLLQQQALYYNIIHSRVATGPASTTYIGTLSSTVPKRLGFCNFFCQENFKKRNRCETCVVLIINYY